MSKQKQSFRIERPAYPQPRSLYDFPVGHNIGIVVGAAGEPVDQLPSWLERQHRHPPADGGRKPSRHRGMCGLRRSNVVDEAYCYWPGVRGIYVSDVILFSGGRGITMLI